MAYNAEVEFCLGPEGHQREAAKHLTVLPMGTITAKQPLPGTPVTTADQTAVMDRHNKLCCETARTSSSMLRPALSHVTAGEGQTPLPEPAACLASRSHSSCS